MTLALIGSLYVEPANRRRFTFQIDPVQLAWLPVVVGLAILYVPAYQDVARVFWINARDSHGPVILAMWSWLAWRERATLRIVNRTAVASSVGWLLIAVGGLLYAIGRSQEAFQLEIGSQLALLPGVVLVMLGTSALRRLWFVMFFLLFQIPLPGSLVDALLVPLKEFVSAVVTQLLFHAGLPVARDGVVIYAGPYQLFIADACAGLNQLVALAAVGMVYVYIAGQRTRSLNLLLLSAIVPVAMLANLTRVMVLVLATYYGGDALGQRLHDYVGYLEILLAFGAFLVLDRVVCRLGKHR